MALLGRRDIRSLAATLGLAAVCWVLAVREMNGMDMGVATRLGPFAFFTGLVGTMMAAMMLPGTAPAVLRNANVNGPLSRCSFVCRAVPCCLGTRRYGDLCGVPPARDYSGRGGGDGGGCL